MRALVTGSHGFVGRHMCAVLYERGYDITTVDIRAIQPLDEKDCRDFFKQSDERFDLVVHLAAIVGGRVKIEGDPIGVAVDLGIDAEMFGWAVRTRQPRVIYYSSSAAYPVQKQQRVFAPAGRRLTEDDINLDNVRSPDLSYGWTKLTGEQLARYAEAEGVRVHVFRPFSGYGSDQDENYPFPAFAARARRRARPFEVWGDGEQVRDFIHIDDVIGSTLAAVDQDYPDPLNLCTGIPTSFNDLARAFMSAAGYRAPIEHRPAQPTGVFYRVGDPANMLKVYQPKVTLQEGIRRALA